MFVSLAIAAGHAVPALVAVFSTPARGLLMCWGCRVGSAKRGRRPKAGGAGGAKPQEAVLDYGFFGGTFSFLSINKNKNKNRYWGLRCSGTENRVNGSIEVAKQVLANLHRLFSSCPSAFRAAGMGVLNLATIQNGTGEQNLMCDITSSMKTSDFYSFSS